MKIMVTGGAGFIGTNLVKRLLADGHQVTVLDNYDTGTPTNEQPGALYYKLDVQQISLVNESYDLCFHLAALSRVQPSFADPAETFRVNVSGTSAVCDWARKKNIKVVYAGSSSRWHDPYQSPYAMYKYLGEEVCKMYRVIYKTKVEIARFYNVYGPFEAVGGDKANVIGIWRQQVLDGQKITIVGDGEQRRDFTHADDIVDALIRIGMSDESHEDAWELGTGINYSVNEVYQMFKDRFGVECVYIPDQPGNYRKTLRENDDSLNRLGWSPSDRLRQYIQTL
jgi:UDP-glucose 4-epimerase